MKQKKYKYWIEIVPTDNSLKTIYIKSFNPLVYTKNLEEAKKFKTSKQAMNSYLSTFHLGNIPQMGISKK